jgi:hypothetical protein
MNALLNQITRLLAFARTVPNFPAAFRGILQSALLMERDRSLGCGAVLVAKKGSDSA